MTILIQFILFFLQFGIFILVLTDRWINILFNESSQLRSQLIALKPLFFFKTNYCFLSCELSHLLSYSAHILNLGLQAKGFEIKILSWKTLKSGQSYLKASLYLVHRLDVAQTNKAKLCLLVVSWGCGTAVTKRGSCRNMFLFDTVK